MKRLFAVLLFIVSVFNSMAQENDNQYYIKVASFRSLPTDMDARVQAPVKDQNGNTCALIKITTNVKGLIFESPATGITKQIEMKSLGEVWVYVPAGSRTVSIFHGMCKPVRNYNYPEVIESSVVYEMTLESNLPKDYLFEIYSNDDIIYNDDILRNVNFTVQPSNAQIILRKIPQHTDEHGIYSTQMPLGRFHYKVTAENYHDYEGLFDIKELDNNIPINVQLRKHTGSLNVKTTPTGAHIFVDGEEIGCTPLTKPWEATVGSHEVKFVLSNHKTETRDVEILNNTITPVEVVLSNSGEMSINSFPSAARLYIDNKYVGNTPYKEEMISGDYSIRLDKKGFRTLTKHVHLDSSLPEQNFSLARQYQDKKQSYITPFFQIPNKGVGANVGVFINNINIETSYILGLETESIYWHHSNSSEHVKEKLSSSSIGVKIGYSIIPTSRFRITPQLGISYLMFKGDYFTKGNATSTSLGTRLDYAVANHVSLVAIPEYCIRITESFAHKRVSAISSPIRNWSNGFNLRLGISFYL